jgi:hypothetical protein
MVAVCGLLVKARTLIWQTVDALQVVEVFFGTVKRSEHGLGCFPHTPMRSSA